MSVNRNSNSSVQSYNDLSVQTVGVFVTIPDATTSGVTNDENVSADYTFEPAGGLDRDELAELVAIDRFVYGSAQASAGDSDTEPGSVTHQFEVAADEEFLNELPQLNPGESDINETGAPGGAGGPAGTTTDAASASTREYEDNPGLLDLWQDTYSTYFNDTVNGTGGGSEAHASERHVQNYRDMFGGGPVFDRLDDITVRQQFFRQVVSAQVFQRGYIRLYWDVHKGDDGRNF